MSVDLPSPAMQPPFAFIMGEGGCPSTSFMSFPRVGKLAKMAAYLQQGSPVRGSLSWRKAETRLAITAPDAGLQGNPPAFLASIHLLVPILREV